MNGHQIFTGTVVEQNLDVQPSQNKREGLYLLTQENQLLALIWQVIYAQQSLESLHTQSRPHFQEYLGKTVTVQGLLRGQAIYEAKVTEIIKNSIDDT